MVADFLQGRGIAILSDVIARVSKDLTLSRRRGACELALFAFHACHWLMPPLPDRVCRKAPAGQDARAAAVQAPRRLLPGPRRCPTRRRMLRGQGTSRLFLFGRS